MALILATWPSSNPLNELCASRAADQAAPWLYQQRESFSASMAVLMLGALLISLTSYDLQKSPARTEQTLQVELSPTEPAPAPLATAAPLPMPVPAQATRSVLPSKPAALRTLTPAVTAPATSSEPAQLATPPAVISTEAQPVGAVTATAEVTRSVTPSSPGPTQGFPALTNRYEAQILRYLESIKRYPSNREARLTRPAGIVTIWFDLSRAGQVLDAGIEKSSNSSLLDFEALKTVRSGSFPQFPETLFSNAENHRFSAHLSYELKASE